MFYGTANSEPGGHCHGITKTEKGIVRFAETSQVIPAFGTGENGRRLESGKLI